LYSVDFNMNDDGKDISIIYNRDNVCLFGVFSLKSNPEAVVIIANCHLLYNIKRSDVKLGQIYQIL